MTNDHAFTNQDKHAIKDERTYAGALSFLRRRYTKELDDFDLAVVGVPLDVATSNRPGARFGPRAIRSASTLMASMDPYTWETNPLERVAVADWGDISWNYNRPDLIPNIITEKIDEVLATETSTLCFGGDHYVTYPILKSFAKKYGSMSIIHFDAHSDTWADDDENSMDHGTMLYHASNQGVVDPSRSVQVGIRTSNSDLRGFYVLDAPWVHGHSPKDTAQRIREIVADHPTYITFDIDCLDPSFAPGTGTPVCGGLSTHQALSILRELAGINVVGMDVVEVSPAYDVGEITALAGATIAFEMICVFAANQRLGQQA